MHGSLHQRLGQIDATDIGLNVSEATAASVDVSVRGASLVVAHFVAVPRQHDIARAETVRILLPLQSFGHEGPVTSRRRADGIGLRG